MKKEIEIQQENIQTLIKLATENPTLKIVPMVNSEIIQDDSYSFWVGNWGKAEIDECYCEDERIYFKSNDFEELVDKYLEIYTQEAEMYEGESEAIATEEVNKLKWEKVIAVHITTP